MTNQNANTNPKPTLREKLVFGAKFGAAVGLLSLPGVCYHNSQVKARDAIVDSCRQEITQPYVGFPAGFVADSAIIPTKGEVIRVWMQPGTNYARVIHGDGTVEFKGEFKYQIAPYRFYRTSDGSLNPELECDSRFLKDTRFGSVFGRTN